MAVDVRVLLAVLLGLCWRPPPAVEGVTFSLTGYDSIPTDGSGRVLITDINPTGDNNEDALICRSEIDTFTTIVGLGTNWFLDPTGMSTDEGDRIPSPEPRGWNRNRDLDSGRRLVRLRRSSATAEEGVFTCTIAGDNNSPRSLGIYYRIMSVTASIDVESGREGRFRVNCTSSGGRALSMSVTGPGGFSEDLDNIQAEGTTQRMGSDRFSGSIDIIPPGGSDGQVYECTASNGLSPDPTGSVELRVANPPTITLQRVSASVRVTWSQPLGGATVTSYIVHYSDGDSNMMRTVSPPSTTTDITGLTGGTTYTISVEATSQHLSGESQGMTITLPPPPSPPSGVMVDGEDDTSVTVSWGAVDGADSYTVTFTKTRGAAQEGLCIDPRHVVSVSVDAPSISASIGVGEMLAGDDTTMLRAYTTYSITVVAVNGSGSSGNSVAITVTTAQIGATAAPRNVMAAVVGSTDITIQFDGLPQNLCRHVNGLIDMYRVQYTEVASGVVKSVNVPGDWDITNVETSLTGLTPFTNYSIQVAAVNMEGDVGVYSGPLVRQTDEDTPGPVMIIETFPSFFKIRITWSPPERPNGIITGYEVSYRPTDSSQPPTTTNTGLETSFTTPSNLELGTEFNFSVRASTRVPGFGETASVTVSTLTRPPAVQGVKVSFDDTSVTVSWDDLIIPDFPVTTYTVVYRQLSEQEDEEMSVEVSDTSTVISALNSDNIYQFEVFATVTVDGTPLQGDRSSPMYLTRPLVVQGVEVEVFNDTAVTVSWNSIQSYPVDFYTVVYSPVSQRRRRQDGGEMSAVFPPPATSGVIGGLDPATDYQFQVFANVTVDGVTLQGEGSAPVSFGIDDSRRSTGSDNTGAIAGGVIVAIILALVVVGILVVVIYIWMKRRDRDSKSSYKPSSEQSEVPLAAVHYSKPSDHTSNGEKTTEPKITRFPEDKHVVEGEKVVFRVKVTGIPQPKVTWYHNGEEVVGDYSKELSEDGSLTMPSAEAKLSGVYQLVAMNKAGSMEREVKLFVKQEGQPSPYVARKQIHFAPIPVDEFGNYVAKCHSNDNRDFRDQYTELDNDADHPTTIGSSPNLKLLNRFANITVYDNNRIMLRPIDGHSDCQRDFINACYVDGYKLRNKFIATQGPLPKTVVDFWRLVWQEKPPTIVMVTNLKEGTRIKCQQYWPESGSKSFGPFQVTISDHQTLADYTTRSLLVQLTGSAGHPLKVTQFHFTAWPDHGVPDYATPILAFHRKFKKQHRPSKGPLLIHCSAGVGRTGTLITIDRVLDQIEKERVVDIAGVIQQLRNQRMKMVQNPEQYIFINDAILEAVTCGDTQIAASDLRRTIQKLSRRDPQTHSTGFESQFKVLDQVSPNPREVLRDKALENPNKNRSEDFLPSDRWRVVLKGEVDDYIHAVVVNGYKQQRAFIIAQSPMQSTVRDFWKMVYDRKCGVIVMLSALVEAGKEVCHQYWPKSGMMPVGEFTVDCIGEENMEGFIIRTLSVLHNKSGKAQQVIQLQMTNWAPDGRCSNLTSIVDAIGEMSKIQRRTGNHPILIHCSDTVSRSGMFCAIATTIERCKTEGVVDVFQVVKALRVQKPGAVRTVSQYHTLFEAVLVYLDSFDTYGNFQDL